MTRALAATAVALLVAAASGAPASTAMSSLTAADIAAPRSTAALAAWCGSVSQTDRAPNGVAGNPIQWVYAIPSDGADNLAGLASVMQADSEQID